MRPGFFQLKTAADLLAKLERDLARLDGAPDSVDHAFNFFVTAESLLDWVYPGDEYRSERTREREASELLQLCSHLASGAKHFELHDKRHRSVASTEVEGGYLSDDYLPTEMFPPEYFGPPTVVVRLSGEARQALGDELECVQLARRVFWFWKEHPRLAESSR